MAIGKRSRDNLRNHRKFIIMALLEYIEEATETIGAEKVASPIRIMSSLRSTRIRLPRNIIPDEFINMVLAENDAKKYRIEFCQNCTDYIQVILHGKPLIEEGQGILLFFLRELLQHLKKIPKAPRPSKLTVAVNN